MENPACLAFRAFLLDRLEHIHGRFQLGVGSGAARGAQSRAHSGHSAALKILHHPHHLFSGLVHVLSPGKSHFEHAIVRLLKFQKDEGIDPRKDKHKNPAQNNPE